VPGHDEADETIGVAISVTSMATMGASPIVEEADALGFDATSFGRNPKIELFNTAELLAGMQPDLPSLEHHGGFRCAASEKGPKPKQGTLCIE